MKIPVRLPIKEGVKYYTKDGRAVKIYSTNGASDTPIHGEVSGYIRAWNEEGAHPSMEELNIIHEEWVPKDKDLVWAWNDDSDLCRCLRFYDAKNNAVFSSATGARDAVGFKYYAPYDGEWTLWAIEARKKLKD